MQRARSHDAKDNRVFGPPEAPEDGSAERQAKIRLHEIVGTESRFSVNHTGGRSVAYGGCFLDGQAVRPERSASEPGQPDQQQAPGAGSAADGSPEPAATVLLVAVANKFAADGPCHLGFCSALEVGHSGAAQAIGEGGIALDCLHCRAVGGGVGGVRQHGAARTFTDEKDRRVGADGCEFSMCRKAGPVFPILAVRQVSTEVAGGLYRFLPNQQMAAVGKLILDQESFQQTAVGRSTG